MKQRYRCVILILAAVWLGLMPCATAQSLPKDAALPYTVFTVDGPEGSRVSYPMLTENSIAADAINRQVMEEARIDEYIALLGRLSAGGTGLKVTCAAAIGDTVYSVLITAEGKMLSGPPAKVYYPMTFDRVSGERMPFDALLSEPETAKEQIESLLSEEVEPQLSDYMGSSSLFPVPYEHYYLDGQGHITVYYEKDQLSFLSDDPGAVAFRYSELWDVLNTEKGGPCMDVQRGDFAEQYAPTRSGTFSPAKALTEWCENGCLAGITQVRVGDTLEEAMDALRATTDSGYYPGGAYYETEHPALRGTLLLTDEREETVTGILTSRLDSFGIETGRTTLQEAVPMLGSPSAIMNLDAETAESYLVCPGQAAVWAVSIRAPEGAEMLPGSYTLFADTQGIIRYIRLAYTN